MLPAERRKALGSLETVFERPGVTAQDVLATKTHTDAVLASSSEKVRSIRVARILLQKPEYSLQKQGAFGVASSVEALRPGDLDPH